MQFAEMKNSTESERNVYIYMYIGFVGILGEEKEKENRHTRVHICNQFEAGYFSFIENIVKCFPRAYRHNERYYFLILFILFTFNWNLCPPPLPSTSSSLPASSSDFFSLSFFPSCDETQRSRVLYGRALHYFVASTSFVLFDERRYPTLTANIAFVNICSSLVHLFPEFWPPTPLPSPLALFFSKPPPSFELSSLRSSAKPFRFLIMCS